MGKQGQAQKPAVLQRSSSECHSRNERSHRWRCHLASRSPGCSAGMSRVRRTRQVLAGRESLTVSGLPSQIPGLQRIQPQTPSCLSALLPLAAWPHLVPGVAGALSSVVVPAAPLKGQHHVPALVRVEHRVPTWDVNVEELCGAAWCFHTHQVREHVVACP